MTQAEFDKAREIYFQRCAGCRRAAQGRDRQAADPGHHAGQGYRLPWVFIEYGSPAGMPNWGTSGELSKDEVDLMARYIKQDAPTARVRHG